MQAFFSRLGILAVLLWSATGCVTDTPAVNIDATPAEQVGEATPPQQFDETIPIDNITINDTTPPAEEVAVPPAPVEPPIFQKGTPPLSQDILLPYFVHKGENLCTIAKKVYGEESYANDLATINHLKDPNKIYAGDLVYYPSLISTQEYTQQMQKNIQLKIIVRKGDTLWSLSKQVLGSGANWRILWKMNPHIADPHRIKVGDQILFTPSVTWTEDRPLPQTRADLL